MSDLTNQLIPSDSGFRDEKLIVLESVDSSNNYAIGLLHEGLATPGTAFLAIEQLAGKGQRGKRWAGQAGENIYLSLIISPKPLEIFQQFLLSAAIALGCRDLLAAESGDEWSIKWPNDLYWRDRKAAGILIENSTQGTDWLFAVAGIGINVNQTLFSEDLPNPVSLKQITGKTYSIVDLARALCHSLQKRIDQLKKDSPRILQDYNSVLYKRGLPVRLRKDNIIFETTILSVTALGELLTMDALERNFTVGEVQFTA